MRTRIITWGVYPGGTPKIAGPDPKVANPLASIFLKYFREKSFGIRNINFRNLFFKNFFGNWLRIVAMTIFLSQIIFLRFKIFPKNKILSDTSSHNKKENVYAKTNRQFV